MTEKQVIVSDQLINYLTNDSADPAALAVVFLHGWLVKAAVWAPILQRLENQGYNLYALDLPGFGKSQPLKDDFDLDGYVKVVKGFIEKMGLARVCLVGHSFGGRIAIKLSAEYPDLIEKLVLVDSAGFKDESLKKKFFAFAAKFLRPIFYIPLVRVLRPQAYRLIGSDYLNTSVDLRPAFLKIINEDLTEYLPKINVPTLIIWGENDRDTPLEFGRRIHSHIQHSIFHILKNAGHVSFLDQPDDFLKLVIDFLKE